MSHRNPVGWDCLCLCVTKTTYKMKTVTLLRKPQGFIFTLEYTEPIHPLKRRASGNQQEVLPSAQTSNAQDRTRTKTGAGRSFMPASFTNGKMMLLLQLTLAFQNQLGDIKKKGQRNNFPSPSKAIFDTDRKRHSFSFFQIL